MKDQRVHSEEKTDSKGVLTQEKWLMFQREISLRLLTPRLLLRVHIFWPNSDDPNPGLSFSIKFLTFFC